MCVWSDAWYAKACYRADHPNNRKQGVYIYYKESLGVSELKLSNLVNVLFMKSPCKAVKDIGVILKKNVKDIGAILKKNAKQPICKKRLQSCWKQLWVRDFSTVW